MLHRPRRQRAGGRGLRLLLDLRDVTALDRDQCRASTLLLTANAMKAPSINIIAILLVNFLLTTHDLAVAQGLEEATALTQRVVELANEGRYAEAIPLAQRALAIRQHTLGSDHPDVAALGKGWLTSPTEWRLWSRSRDDLDHSKF